MRIIAIIGPSGAGKDTAARILSEMTDIPVLVSYTTRPKRDGEINGKEHCFVRECHTPHDQMLAYTMFGGYEYWTERTQVSDNVIYVIDEQGYKSLCEHHPDIDVITLNVRASLPVRRVRGVSPERIHRDDDRDRSIAIMYDFVIYNNYTMTRLRRNLKYVSNKIMQLINKNYEEDS